MVILYSGNTLSFREVFWLTMRTACRDMHSRCVFHRGFSLYLGIFFPMESPEQWLNNCERGSATVLREYTQYEGMPQSLRTPFLPQSLRTPFLLQSLCTPMLFDGWLIDWVRGYASKSAHPVFASKSAHSHVIRWLIDWLSTRICFKVCAL